MPSRLESLYPAMPTWLQHLGISFYGLACRKERLGGRFKQYVAEFKERDGWPVVEMNEYIERELHRVLGRALSEVPYYARTWRARSIEAGDFRKFTMQELQLLPTTPKEALRENPYDFVSARVRSSRCLRRYHSSGTTGRPITAICTADGHRRFIAAREARSFAWAGTSVTRPRSMIGGRILVPKGVSKPPFHRYNWAEKQLYFSAFDISPENAPHYVAALNKYQPKVLTGYAYSHFLLGRLMLEQKLSLEYQPEALVLSSEKLTAQMKSVIRQAFRARAYEEYGCVENCMLATQCEHGHLHVSSDFGLVEIVDEQGRAVPPGVEGRIVCTSLLNEVQPLIRYETGDMGVWSDEPCPCGRNHLPVLKEVIGRLEDVVTGPDGRQMVRFHGLFIDLPNIVEGQVVQETPEKFTVRVVTVNGFGESEASVIRNRFEERLGKVLVNVERVREIPRAERGKLRAVLSKLDADATKSKVGL